MNVKTTNRYKVCAVGNIVHQQNFTCLATHIQQELEH